MAIFVTLWTYALVCRAGISENHLKTMCFQCQAVSPEGLGPRNRDSTRRTKRQEYKGILVEMVSKGGANQRFTGEITHTSNCMDPGPVR